MTRTLLAGVALAVALAGCGGDGSSAPASRWARTVAGLCAAVGQARAGDIGDARTTFFDQSHDDLHELADEAAGDDRGAAADLLEAKEAVEADFAGSPASLADDLDTLVVATRAAIRATGDPVPAGCSS